MRIGLPLTPFLSYQHNLSGEYLSAFESGEQVYPVSNSPGVDMCEQPVWVGLEWIRTNARPIRIKFVQIGIVSGYV